MGRNCTNLNIRGETAPKAAFIKTSMALGQVRKGNNEGRHMRHRKRGRVRKEKRNEQKETMGKNVLGE